ncbi:VOC family protein [Priestia megaterium]|nr:VOC family protein [Priestia megaterium]
MNISFDHLVHFSPYPKKAKKEMLAHGITVIDGGRHEKWGTFNTLAYFGLSYIEWLGFDHLQFAKNVNDNLLIQQFVKEHTPFGHFGRFAFRTHNMNELMDELQKKDYVLHGPVSGYRQTSDGQFIEWKMCFIEGDDRNLPLPFFIEWSQSDEERHLQLAAHSSHKLGPLQLQNIYCAVHNIEDTVAKWSRLLDAQPGERYEDPAIHAECQKLYLHGGNLIFCHAKHGIVHDTLNRIGERPFLVEFDHGKEAKWFSVQGGTFKINK